MCCCQFCVTRSRMIYNYPTDRPLSAYIISLYHPISIYHQPLSSYQQLIEKVLHAGLRFFTHSGSCNLLYALFICKQVRHTCCLSLHVYVHCIACDCMVLYVPCWLSSNAWASNPPWLIGTNWPILCWRAVKHQSINQSYQHISASIILSAYISLYQPEPEICIK